MSELLPAVFLDRDGTLIEDVGVLKDPGMISIFPWTTKSLLELQKHYLLFVITNQAGISQGMVRRDEVDYVHASMNARLSREGVRIIEYYVCPHTAGDVCQCRKPRPWFMQQASTQFHIDLKKSFMIGDHYSDVLTGREQGVTGLYVLTGHGKKHLSTVPNDEKVFSDLREASKWILEANAGSFSPPAS